jgi:serine phosphatase RsbU (regulator of sigma subunit)/PAS domain-containing protein
VAVKTFWGDVKYVGIAVLAPAWLVFALQYTGRGRLVTRKVMAALTVEPLVLMALLAFPKTHDLVRYYPADAVGKELAVVQTGWAFWGHFVYAYGLILVGMVVFVATMVRLSRTYRRMAVTLVAAALLPWAANALHNFEVGPFARLDLTPFLFVVTGGVLVWGVFRERLLNLSPLARGVIVDTMIDAVFVLDAFGRVVEVNPAGSGVLGRTRPELVGRRLDDLLPQPEEDPEGGTGRPPGELSLGMRIFDVRRQPLTDRNSRPAGELVVLRDITERVLAEQHLQGLLVERSRVAAALQASLVPGELPAIPTSEVASRYEPAGDGREIGGDFFDVFALGDDSWGLVLGDVSGKGAEAAAVTALARYTLRTLADAKHRPSRTLRELNARLSDATDIERHCTLVYAIARPHAAGLELTVCLAGHHPPLVLRCCSGRVEPIGELGTALGLIADPDLFDSRVILAPGDLMCMFTDGLVEARDGIDLFGSERVATLLTQEADSSVDEIAARLVAAARTFHGGRDLSDDLALLMLRVLTPSRMRAPAHRAESTAEASARTPRTRPPAHRAESAAEAGARTLAS